MTIKRAAGAVFIGILAATSVACSAEQAGQPTPSAGNSGQSSSPNETTESNDDPGTLAAQEPCSLLTADELDKYGEFPPGQEQNVGTARGCKFEKKTDSASTDPHRVISVGLRDRQGIDEAQDMGMGVEHGEVDGRQYARVPGPGGCVVIIGVSDNSRVDITANVTEGTEKACTIADEVAAIVEPKLPQG